MRPNEQLVDLFGVTYSSRTEARKPPFRNSVREGFILLLVISLRGYDFGVQPTIGSLAFNFFIWSRASFSGTALNLARPFVHDMN